MKTEKQSKTLSSVLDSLTAKLPLIFGFIILMVLFYLLYVFLRTILTTLTPTTVTILVAMLTGLSAFIVSFISKHLEQKALIVNEHRQKKIPVYEELMKFLFKLMMADKTKDKPLTEKEIIKFMSNFTQKILVWGADDVILKFYKFRQVGILCPDNPPPNILFCVEDLLLAIRKDLGHKNKGLDRGKLLGLFVNDIDEFMAKNITIV